MGTQTAYPITPGTELVIHQIQPRHHVGTCPFATSRHSPKYVLRIAVSTQGTHAEYTPEADDVVAFIRLWSKRNACGASGGEEDKGVLGDRNL